MPEDRLYNHPYSSLLILTYPHSYLPMTITSQDLTYMSMETLIHVHDPDGETSTTCLPPRRLTSQEREKTLEKDYTVL